MSTPTSSPAQSRRTVAERFAFGWTGSERYVFWIASLFFVFEALAPSVIDIGLAWHEALGLAVLFLIASYVSDLHHRVRLQEGGRSDRARR
jgi:hypothetical protein